MKSRSAKILLILAIGFSGWARIAGAHQGADAKRTVPNAQASSETAGPVAVHAAQRGNPQMNLLDGHAVRTNYAAGSNSSPAQMQNAQPLALASADFDEDGVPDIVSGFTGGNGAGMVQLHRGNVNALWPYGAAILNGPPPEFLPDAKVFSVPEQPDFIGVGDFNADGHWDIVVARRGSNALWFLLGDGHGNFSAPQRLQLSGVVTALITGEINRADGLNDIVIGVNGENGAKVLVYEGPAGAMRATPEIIGAPVTVTALALGRIDGGAFIDLAIGAGNQLMMVHGRDRMLSVGSSAHGGIGLPKAVQQTLPFSIRALAVGNFSGFANLAALGDDGAVHLLENAHAIGNLAAQVVIPNSVRTSGPGGNKILAAADSPAASGAVSRQQQLIRAAAQRMSTAQKSSQGGTVAAEWTVSDTIAWPSATSGGTDVMSAGQLVATRISTAPTDDLLVVDRAASQIHVLSNTAESTTAARKSNTVHMTPGAMTIATSLDVTGGPVAVLPMRLNQHPLQSLVMLANGESAPIVSVSVPPLVLVVTSTGDEDGVSTTLRGAINFSNVVATGASAPPVSIIFDIPLSDPGCDQNTHVCTIRPTSVGKQGGDEHALPALFGPVTIDGYTQPGSSPNTLANGDNAVILIRVDGSLATTPGGEGFDIFEQPGTIRGINIAGWHNPDLVSQPGFAVGGFGIRMDGVAAYSEGNFIGTNGSGTASDAIADSNILGIFLANGPTLGSGALGNVVGGTTPQARNIISGNRFDGIQGEFDTPLSQIQGNFIGTDVTGTKPLGNGGDGILAPTLATIGGTLAGAGNLISGNGAFNVDINAIDGAGLAHSDVVQGNFIGTDVTGTKSLGSAPGIVVAVNYQLATIGGTSSAARNIIAGSPTADAIQLLDYVTNITIQGNYIGTDVTGTHALSPRTIIGIFSGVLDEKNSAGDTIHGIPPYNNVIGGTAPGAGNIISGNSADAIKIAGSNNIQGNPSAQALIGDTIQGNLIGTDVTGTLPIPNGGNGISFTSATTTSFVVTYPPSNNIIGGTDPGASNLIANNVGHGVLMDSGNGNATAGNTIQNNGGAGVRITGGNGNPISRNSIFGNGALGIDLDTAGPNANSHCQANINGANLLQNSPVLTAGTGSTFLSATATDSLGNTSEFSNTVNLSGSVLNVLGAFDGKPNSSFTIEFFTNPSADASGFGQGKIFLTSTTVTTNATCSATINPVIDTAQADVSVNLSLLPPTTTTFVVGPQSFGQDIYASTVTNNGASIAHNVTWFDQLPASLLVRDNTQASCSVPAKSTLGSCLLNSNAVTCNLGTMAPGETAHITVPVQAISPGSISNSVTVSGTETDPIPANNTASLTNNSVNAFPFPETLVPSAIVKGGPDLTLTVFGVGFTPTTTIQFNGTQLSSTFFDNQVCNNVITGSFLCEGLQIVVPAAMLSTAGDATIFVANGATTGSSTFSGFIKDACVFTINPAGPTFSIDATGTIGSLQNIVSADACSWTASSSSPFVLLLDSDLAAGGTRVGSSRANYAVSPNSGAARTGTITMAGQTFTFQQAGGALCTYTLDSNSAHFSATGGAGTVAVTPSDPSCFWVQSSFSPFVISPSQAGTIGSGSVSYSVTPNVGGPRTGEIAIGTFFAGAIEFTVTQDAPSNCFFTLSSSSGAFPTPGGTGSFGVIASQPSCAWTATSSLPFTNITSGASGTGNGTVNYTVASNAGDGRISTITVANSAGSSVTYAVNQASANVCTFSLSQLSKHFSADGGSDTVGFSSSFQFCTWTAQSNDPGLLIARTSGAFGDPLPYTVTQNTGAARTMTMTVGCLTYTIIQDGVGATNPVPAITSLAPPSVAVAGLDFALTVNGANFVNGATVLFNGLPRVTTFVNSGQISAAIFARDVDLVGTRSVVVTNPVPGGGVSNSVTFNVTGSNPVPVITTLSPANGIAGTNAFTLTVNGTGFDSASVVSFGGTPRVTTFVSPTQLTAAILAADIATAGTPAAVVTNPAPGGGPSNSVTFPVTSPVPTISSISPTTTAAGSALFIITVQGTNFVNGCTVNFGSVPESTIFLNPFTVLAIINAADVANPGTPSVTITNPGGSPSNGMTFTITGTGNGNPLPSISSLSPTGTTAGSGAFTLTVTGANFVSGATVNFNGTARTTTFGSATQLTAAISAADVATVGTPAVSVTNPTPGGGTSNSINFNISAASNPAPTISSLVPAATTAGGPTFSLTVNGTNLISTSVVSLNGSPRTTTFTNGTQVTATITAADIATAGSASINVTNPAPGGGMSAAATLTINNPVPTVTTLSPASALAGGAGFTLTVTGTGFVSSSVVNFNHVARTTAFVNSTQLTATIPATDIATAGSQVVDVTNPAPGGGTATAVTFQVNNPVPTVTTLSPTSATAGSAAFTLTINGTNFVNGATVSFGGVTRAATVTSSAQLTTQILPSDIASVATPAVTVTNPTPGGGTSNSVNFNVTAAANPVPSITSLAPTGVTAGSGALTLTVNGTNFISSAVVNFGGSPRTTTFISVTQLTAAILSSDVTTVGTPAVTVTNPIPGGGTSNAVNFNISAAPNPVPTVTTLLPANVIAGSGALTLTVNGTNFLNTSVVNFGGAARVTTFVSATQLTAAILAGDVAAAGSPAVIVTNPAPGGGASNAVTFTTNNPQPVANSVTPNTVSAGSGAFTMTVNGSGFIGASVVQWNGNARTTTFVSATQLTAAITAADVQTANLANVSVRNPAPGGGNSLSLQFSITTPIPSLGSLAPNSAIAGGTAFTLTLNGSNFIGTSVVQWNGSARATTFASATQLTAAIGAADIAGVGTSSVTVFTPAVNLGGGANPLGAPAGITSNSLTFTINAANPVPTLTSLSPPTTGAGGTAFTLTLNGTNFIGGSVAQWKGGARTTTFVSATQLTAAIAAADIASSGAAAITVVNPTPGGGTSNALTFTITDFSVTGQAAQVPVTAGQSGTFTISTGTVGGAFPGAVTLAATGLPTGASASFNPAAVSAGTSTTMTVTTTARGSAQITAPPFSPIVPMRLVWVITLAMLFAIVTTLATTSIAKFGRHTARRLIPISVLALLLISVGYISGCSGGGFPKVGSLTGTPSGTYTITVTGASGVVQHSTTVTLVVQ